MVVICTSASIQSQTSVTNRAKERESPVKFILCNSVQIVVKCSLVFIPLLMRTSGKMTSLCYPYGAGITCVCDETTRIYKCFPDIKSDQGGSPRGGSSGGVLLGANTQMEGVHNKLGMDSDTFDRR